MGGNAGSESGAGRGGVRGIGSLELYFDSEPTTQNEEQEEDEKAEGQMIIMHK